MTATLETRLATARSKLGYAETGGADGHSGNVTVFWAELAPSLQGSPWCAAFQRWVEIHSGGPDLPISNPYYCPAIVTYARRHGLWLPPDKGSPGDLVLFTWAKNGVADHIGLIETRGAGGYKTIEGNTSRPSAGTSREAQRNGGGVYERNRSFTNGTVLGVLDYSKLLKVVVKTGSAPRKTPKANPDLKAAAPCKKGAKGDQVRFVQWAVGVPVDGVFGNQTFDAVKEFQRHHGLVVDGVVGNQTIGALRAVTH